MRTKEKIKLNFFQSIKIYLPKGYLKTIADKIEKPVSNRLILYVLNDKRNDNYGIKDIALEIALENKSKIELQKKRIKVLTSAK